MRIGRIMIFLLVVCFLFMSAQITQANTLNVSAFSIIEAVAIAAPIPNFDGEYATAINRFEGKTHYLYSVQENRLIGNDAYQAKKETSPMYYLHESALNVSAMEPVGREVPSNLKLPLESFSLNCTLI